MASTQPERLQFKDCCLLLLLLGLLWWCITYIQRQHPYECSHMKQQRCG
jgi:hypothetical protein